MVRPLRSLAPACYIVAALLLLLPTMDYLNDAWPFRPAVVEWRYDVEGMISTYVLLPLLGLLLASVTAAFLKQTAVSRWLSLIVWIGAILLVVVLVGFVQDSLQVRSTAFADARWVTTRSFLLAAGKILIAALTLMILGVGNLRAARAVEPGVGPRKSPPLPPIIGHL